MMSAMRLPARLRRRRGARAPEDFPAPPEQEEKLHAAVMEIAEGLGRMQGYTRGPEESREEFYERLKRLGVW
jgi:hypothetical protein